MNDELTIRLLQTYWPLEANAVGQTYLEEIAAGRSGFSEIPGASHIDLSVVLKVLAEASVFIKTSVELVIILRKQFEKPTGKQLNDALAAKKVPPSGLTREEERALLDEIIAATPDNQVDKA